MDEVELGAVRDVGEEGVLVAAGDAVPAHVRHDQVVREAAHLAAQDVEAVVARALVAGGEEDLLPDADAEEGTLLLDRRGDHRRQPARLQVGHRVGGRADAGEDHAVGRQDRRRVVADDVLDPEVAQRVDHAPQVARPVVDDRDHRSLAVSCSSLVARRSSFGSSRARKVAATERARASGL